jgi:hypothetical protein
MKRVSIVASVGILLVGGIATAALVRGPAAPPKVEKSDKVASKTLETARLFSPTTDVRLPPANDPIAEALAKSPTKWPDVPKPPVRKTTEVLAKPAAGSQAKADAKADAKKKPAAAPISR